jgi:3-methyladenine DNA glycosylase AlkC
VLGSCDRGTLAPISAWRSEGTVAEPLKDRFGPDVPVRIAAMIAAVHPPFASDRFVAEALDGYDALELTPRAHQIARALAAHLPADPPDALAVLVASLGPPIERLEGMDSFAYLPLVFFVATYGIDHLEASLAAQYALTQRFTAEFSIRAFLERYPEETLARLRLWAHDPNVHVRRLVSEGTRPRLPWAPRLRPFQQDPAPVLELLELLKDDPEPYVRRSVANNLNDIAKDHPDVAAAVGRRWLEGASTERRALVAHGLRTLVKAGHPGALAALGFETGTPVSVERLTVAPASVAIGGKVRIEVTVRNPDAEASSALVDLRVHFVKANGSLRPKVFKGATLDLEPGATGFVRKTVSLAQHTTRTHYPAATASRRW